MFRSAATKLAHNATIPNLGGNRDLKALQDLIVAEKSVLQTLQKLSIDCTKANECLRAWGTGEGDDLLDVLAASSALLSYFSSSLQQFATHETTVREHMKGVRSREEALDELRRRRRQLGAKAEAAEKKLSKMGPENKSLQQQTELLQQLRSQIQGLDQEIAREEARTGDFKRLSAKNWMLLKFGALLECAEKATIVGEMGKMAIDEIPLERTPPGGTRVHYNGHEKTAKLLAETQRCVAEVVFDPQLMTEADLNSSHFVAKAVHDRGPQSPNLTIGLGGQVMDGSVGPRGRQGSVDSAGPGAPENAPVYAPQPSAMPQLPQLVEEGFDSNALAMQYTGSSSPTTEYRPGTGGGGSDYGSLRGPRGEPWVPSPQINEFGILERPEGGTRPNVAGTMPNLPPDATPGYDYDQKTLPGLGQYEKSASPPPNAQLAGPQGGLRTHAHFASFPVRKSSTSSASQLNIGAPGAPGAQALYNEKLAGLQSQGQGQGQQPGGGFWLPDTQRKDSLGFAAEIASALSNGGPPGDVTGGQFNMQRGPMMSYDEAPATTQSAFQAVGLPPGAAAPAIGSSWELKQAESYLAYDDPSANGGVNGNGTIEDDEEDPIARRAERESRHVRFGHESIIANQQWSPGTPSTAPDPAAPQTAFPPSASTGPGQGAEPMSPNSPLPAPVGSHYEDEKLPYSPHSPPTGMQTLPPEVPPPPPTYSSTSSHDHSHYDQQQWVGNKAQPGYSLTDERLPTPPMDEKSLNAAAAKEVARELDVLSFSPPPATRQAASPPPPSPSSRYALGGTSPLRSPVRQESEEDRLPSPTSRADILPPPLPTINYPQTSPPRSPRDVPPPPAPQSTLPSSSPPKASPISGPLSVSPFPLPRQISPSASQTNLGLGTPSTPVGAPGGPRTISAAAFKRPGGAATRNVSAPAGPAEPQSVSPLAVRKKPVPALPSSPYPSRPANPEDHDGSAGNANRNSDNANGLYDLVSSYSDLTGGAEGSPGVEDYGSLGNVRVTNPSSPGAQGDGRGYLR